MLNLNLFRNIGFPLYLFIYLILPYSAITETLKVDFIRNLETSLNKRDLEFIKKNFRNDENQNIQKQFSKIINDFPDSKWKIKRLKSNIPNKEILRIKVSGKKIVNGEIHILESNFDYVFYVAGVDIHFNDRLGKLKISDEGIKKRDEIVTENFFSKGIPLCGVLGGGYNKDFNKLVELHSYLHQSSAKLL